MATATAERVPVSHRPLPLARKATVCAWMAARPGRRYEATQVARGTKLSVTQCRYSLNLLTEERIVERRGNGRATWRMITDKQKADAKKRQRLIKQAKNLAAALTSLGIDCHPTGPAVKITGLTKLAKLIKDAQ